MRLTATPSTRSREELKALAGVLSRLQAIGADPRQRERVAAIVRAGFADNFAAEAAGTSYAWAGLAPATQIERQQLGYDPRHPILVRTGKYRKSWIDPDDPDHDADTRITDSAIQINEGSSDPRAGELQLGRANMPAREVTPMPARRIEEIGDILDILVRDAIHGRR